MSEKKNIWVVLDYRVQEHEAVPAWLNQVPAAIARRAQPRFMSIEDWGDEQPADVAEQTLRRVASHAIYRARLLGLTEYSAVMDAARLWAAIEKRLGEELPSALMIWGCGRMDQMVWGELARRFKVPVMWVEAGWLPQTRIFDPVGMASLPDSYWDYVPAQEDDAAWGEQIIHYWRERMESKHEQGALLPKQARSLIARGKTLAVMAQLESDASMVYWPAQVRNPQGLLDLAWHWHGPIVAKEHPCVRQEEDELAPRRDEQAARLERRARGGLMLRNNEHALALMQQSHAVTAINSNTLLEAAMLGKPAYAFGYGPHSYRGFTRSLSENELLQEAIEQTPREAEAVACHVGKMTRYLTPVGAWEEGWKSAGFWAPCFDNAAELLVQRWHNLLDGADNHEA